jgi:hypothetical protein
MTPRQNLYDWISEIYKDKKIKISGNPYFEHLIFVAEFAKDAVRCGYEIGLCHDLLEDTNLDQYTLQRRLTELGFAETDCSYIASIVQELSTVYSKATFSHLSKKERHELENQRLAACSAAAQTVKYGDLIYNAHWTADYELKKLKGYLQRKLHLLQQLDKGDRQSQEKAARELNTLYVSRTL